MCHTIMTDLKVLPIKISAFVRAVTTSPVVGFPPILPCDDVEVEEYPNDNWSLTFYSELLITNIRMVLAWIPKGYRCSGIGHFDGVVSVGLSPKTV